MALLALPAVLAILVSSIFLWQSAFARWRSGHSLLPPGPHRVLPWGVLDLAVTIMVYLAFNIAAMSTVHVLLKLPSHTELEYLPPSVQKIVLLVFGLSTLATCVVVILALWARHRISLRDVGWDGRFVLKDVLLGLKAFAMLAPVVYALQLALTQFVESQHPLIELLKKNPDPAYFATAAFAAVIVAPIAEEFLFRVMLQGWLQRFFFTPRESAEALVFGGPSKTVEESEPLAGTLKQPRSEAIAQGGAPATTTLQSPEEFGELTRGEGNPYNSPIVVATPATAQPETLRRGRAAIIVSSLLFALSHWSHGPDPIPLFVFALGLGYLYERTQRILPSIVLHFCLNLFSLLALGLAISQD